jgi:hypothetical protein
MCDACGEEERAIDAALAKYEANQAKRTPRRIGQGGEPWLTWIRDAHGWHSDVEDYTITAHPNGEYALTHQDDTVIGGTFGECVLLAEMHRCVEVPDGP